VFAGPPVKDEIREEETVPQPRRRLLPRRT
jgi:hypothetical protein